VTLLACEMLPPISLSPTLLRWSSARTPFPLFAPLAPAPGKTAESRVSSGPGPEVLYAPCQPQRSPPYSIQSAGSCIPEAYLDYLQTNRRALSGVDIEDQTSAWTRRAGNHCTASIGVGRSIANARMRATCHSSFLGWRIMPDPRLHTIHVCVRPNHALSSVLAVSSMNHGFFL
jgi:hypothetical protein